MKSTSCTVVNVPGDADVLMVKAAVDNVREYVFASDFKKTWLLRFFEMTRQNVVKVFSKRNKTSGFIINISKQQAFETKNLAGLWR